MKEPKTQDEEIDGFKKVCEALEPYSAEDRMRILRAAAILLGLDEILKP